MVGHDVRPLVRYVEMDRAAWRKIRPSSSGHTAVVLVGRDGRLLLVERRLSASEVFYSPPAGIFWVDVGIHHESIQLELPTAEGVFCFLAEVDVAWRVRDPKRAVDDRITIGAEVYRPFIEHEFRQVSRGYHLHQFVLAEQRINGHFADREIKLSGGISLLTCRVRLALEPSGQSHLRQLTYDARKQQRRDAEHEATLHMAELAKAEENARHELALQDARHRHEIAELEEKYRLELEQMRMSFYAQALESGDLGALTFRLAANREDVAEVIDLMMREKQMDFETAHSALRVLLEQRMVNKRDVQDIMARATKIIAEGWRPASAAIVSAASESSREPTMLAKSAAAQSDVETRLDDDHDDDD